MFVTKSRARVILRSSQDQLKVGIKPAFKQKRNYNVRVSRGLIWEASPKERELIEANFPADNEIIQKINERLSIRLNSGSKIRI